MITLNPFKWFRKDKSKLVYTRLDEDTIKRDETIKALQKKIMTQEVQLGKVAAKEKERLDKKKEIGREDERNRRLNEQREDLKDKKFGKIINLDKFYYQVFYGKTPPRNITKYYSKWAKQIEIRDKNNEIVLGKYGGFGIMKGAKLCLKEFNGELMAYGRTLNHILFKPDAFENMARDKKFLIPVDADGNWIEDLEYKEIPEPLDAEFDDETGKIKKINWSRVKTSVVKEVISRERERANFLSNELESSESKIIKLKNIIDDLNRSIKIYESQANISQSNLSKALFRFSESEKRIGEMHTQTTKLIETKAMYENIIDKKDMVIEKVLDKLDLTGDPRSERLRNEIRMELEYYKAILPERIEIKQEAPPEPRVIVQPGEAIK